MPALQLDQLMSSFPSSPAVHNITCRQCRLRKVRCDRQSDGCSNCRRLSFSCSLSSGASQLDAGRESSEEFVVQIRPKRRRGTRACTGCRAQKVKCSGSLPKCATCTRRGISCHYPASKRKPMAGAAKVIGYVLPGPETAVTAIQPQPSDILSSTQGEQPAISPVLSASDCGFVVSDKVSRLVDLFFDRVSALPSYSFLNRQTTRDRAKNRSMEEDHLLCAICGVATRLCGQELDDAGSIKADADAYIATAERAVFRQMDSADLAWLQALLLIINYRIETDSLQKASLLSALAVCAAQEPSICRKQSYIGKAEKESLERTLCALALSGRYLDHGRGVLEQHGNTPRPVKLSIISEEAMNGNLEDDDGGANAIFWRLESVRKNISLLPGPLFDPDVINSQLQALAIGLSEQSLLQTSASSTRALSRSKNPFLSAQVAVKLAWHQCHCEMYRVFLVQYLDSSQPAKHLDINQRANAETLILSHANAILNTLIVLGKTWSELSKPLLEPDAAICAYHAIRSTLSALRSQNQRGEDVHEGIGVLEKAEECLSALSWLFNENTLVKSVIKATEQLLTASYHLRNKTGSLSPFDSPDKSFLSNQTDSSESCHVASMKGVHKKERRISLADCNRERLAIHSLVSQPDLPSNREQT